VVVSIQSKFGPLHHLHIWKNFGIDLGVGGNRVGSDVGKEKTVTEERDRRMSFVLM